jgi:signal transduction histidine kinase/CheY-like chemotaxis protein
MTQASPLRVLLLEDDPGDAGLIQGLLEADGFVCEATRVQTRAEFVGALESPDIDVILADHSLPSFDGFSALKLASSARPDLPFIFVSGSLGEELAIEALQIGATDYVLKTRLSRLVPAVHRALRETQGRAERRRAEEKLRRNEYYLSEAQRLTHTGSWTLNSAGEVYWTEETFRIWAFDPNQPVPDRETILQRVHPEDRDRVRDQGTKAAHEGGHYVEEFRIVLPDGQVRHIHAVGRPVFAANGELIEVVGTHVDVTERKHAEQERERLRELESDLAHMNRVGMMGELAASLAHEIKQPISAAVLNAYSLQRFIGGETPRLAKASEAAASMIANATRAADIIDRVRSLYRRETPERAAVDLNEIVREMTVLLRDTAQRNAIAIRTQLDSTLPTATADRIQLQQVLMNLMLNGIEAMKDNGGELIVASARSEEGQLAVSVSDCGVGLPEGKANRMFDAFFTTKPQGSGMGLSISRRIIESHGGRLWGSSNQGRGATFQFTLPPAPATPAAQPADALGA